MARMSVNRTGTTALSTNSRRRNGLRGLNTAGLPDGDLDTPVAGLRRVVAGLDEQVGLAVRGHVDSGGRKAGLHQDAAYGVGAPQPEREVGLGLAHRIGMPDDDDFGHRERFHRVEDRRYERRRLVGQRIGFEFELEREMPRRRRQRRKGLTEQPRHLFRAHGGHGARRGAGRGPQRSARAGHIDRSELVVHHDAPGHLGLGIGQQHDHRRRRRRHGRRRRDTLAAAAGQQESDQPKLEPAAPAPRTSHRSPTPPYDSTLIATVVPRTPTMPDGASRRIESGASLAIRPDTYTATPRMNFSTMPRPPSPGAYT